jgi:hypothetical protein
MKLLIDSSDYTSHLDASVHPRIKRVLNRPAKLTATLIATDPSFVVPAADARVILERNDGLRVFTGYLDGPPEWEHLGWNERGPVYRYQLKATSDEVVLNRKRLPQRAPMVNRTAGGVLKQLAGDAGSTMDVTGVQNIATIPQLNTSIQRTFSDHAAEIALRTRSAYRVHDGKITLAPVGSVTHTLSDTSDTFDPAALTIERPQKIANDVTVIGRVEPRAYVKDYFSGDDVTLRFTLSETPFTRRNRAFIDEEFTGSALDPVVWAKADPAGVISVSGGKLRNAGGTGVDGVTTVSFVEPIELGGALLMQHGELETNSSANAVIGGLYAASVVRANCFAGFSAQGGVLRALVNGTLTGPSITINATHKYALTTRLYSLAQYRAQERFQSSVASHGGGTVAGNVRVVLEVHEVDPANVATMQAPSTVLYDGVINGAPGFCTYALLNVATMTGSVSFARVQRAVSTEVRSTPPAQATKTRLIGSVAEGAECIILGSQLVFFPAYVPLANETIVMRYRSGGRGVARVRDTASIAAIGERARVTYLLTPPPRTAEDCENAAAALLGDTTQTAVLGSYACLSDFLPNGPASDPLPGDAIAIGTVTGNASAIIREVEIEAVDLADDRCRYSLAFANDAADPLAFDFDKGRLFDEPDPVTPGAGYTGDVPDAEVTAVSSTTVSIDVGGAPVAGGGFEVRRSDTNWGAANDRNLVGRFTTQTFTVPRLTRVQTYCIRMYDAAGKYSRYSTLLHVDIPY